MVTLNVKRFTKSNQKYCQTDLILIELLTLYQIIHSNYRFCGKFQCIGKIQMNPNIRKSCTGRIKNEISHKFAINISNNSNKIRFHWFYCLYCVNKS